MADEDKKEKKGFSGLSDLASEVSGSDDEIGENEEIPEPSVSKTFQSGLSAPKTPFSGKPNPSDAKTSPPLLDRPWYWANFNWKWIAGIIVVVFLVWLGNNGGQSTKKSSFNYSPPNKSSISQKRLQTEVRLSDSETYSNLKFEKPPVGKNNVLYLAQIRWCLREKIRIEAIRGVISTKSKLDEFNRIVDDYNCRCGSFRYRRGAVEQAKREIETIRNQITTQAFDDFIGTPQQASKPIYRPLNILNNRNDESIRPSRVPQSSRNEILTRNNIHADKSLTSNYQLVLETQKLLESLGYDPGPIDGQFGPKTANAVGKFQRDIGIPENNRIDETLLFYLRQSCKSGQNKLYFKNGKTLVYEKVWKDGDTIFVVCKGKNIAVGYPEIDIDMGKSFGRD